MTFYPYICPICGASTKTWEVGDLCIEWYGEADLPGIDLRRRNIGARRHKGFYRLCSECMMAVCQALNDRRRSE